MFSNIPNTMFVSLLLGILLLDFVPFFGNCQKPADSGITIQVYQFQYANGSTVTNTNNVNPSGQPQPTQTNSPPNQNGNIPPPQAPPIVPKPGDYMFEVSFSPFTSYKDGQPTPQDIKYMLKVIQSKFHFIFTNTMGVPDAQYSGQLDNEFPESLISRLAAQVNQESKSASIKVCQGARIFKTGQGQKDLDYALDASRVANAMLQGTVWGISLNVDNQWGSIQDADDISHVHSILQQGYVKKAHELGLKVGVKLDICSEIVDGLNKDKIGEMVKSCDFVSCFVFPPRATESPMDGIASIARIYQKYKQAFLKVNPNLEVIIETGWASSGESDFNPEHFNTVEKQREFWERMESTAKENGMKVRMLEAFDEPTSKKELYRHFGFWKKATNTNGYIEKGTGKIVRM
ncbi:unnamed protein product [Orchesella dallaii]|uniref:Uncharacterized protein n=1 Tax=Orchesella dallaii TaxID=48710 RepID=A0ABP1PPP1_9HEXA